MQGHEFRMIQSKMRHNTMNLRISRLSMTLWFAMPLFGCQAEEPIPPEIAEQTLDLSSWDLFIGPKVWLDGEWLYSAELDALPSVITWETLKEVMPLRAKVPWKEGDPIHPLPQAESGNDTAPESSTEEPAPSSVFYALKVKVGPSFSYPVVFNLSRLTGTWTVGLHYRVGDEERSTFAHYDGASSSLDPKERQVNAPGVWLRATKGLSEVIVTIQGHNIRKQDGFKGLTKRPKILNYYRYISETYIYSFAQVFVLGMCVIVGLYHLMTFTRRRDVTVALYFAVFSFAAAGFIASYSLFYDWVEMGYLTESGRKVVGGSHLVFVLAMVAAGALYIDSSLPSPLSKRMTQLGVGLALLLAIASIALPTELVYGNIVVYHVFFGIALCALMGHCIHQLVAGRPLAGRLTAGFGGICLTGLHDLWGYQTGTFLVADFAIVTFGFVGILVMQLACLSDNLAVGGSNEET